MAESHTFEVIIIAILLIILIIVFTTTIYFYNRRYQCNNYTSPWCYNDWACCSNISDIYAAVNAGNTIPQCQNKHYKWDLLQQQQLSSVDSGPCTDYDNVVCTSTTNCTCPNAWSKGNNAFFNTDGTAKKQCVGPDGSGAPCPT
jgi:hypothetical protein